MVDSFPSKVRSRIMRAIRDRDTRPELKIRRALHARGCRYRLHVKDLPGKPDIVFPKWQAVFLVHGCFWHRHAGCLRASTPSSNATYWLAKFRRNAERDRKNFNALIAAGWRVGVVWECWIGKRLDDSSVDDLVMFLKDQGRDTAEWPVIGPAADESV